MTLVEILVAGCFVFLVLASIVAGVSGIVARDFWWRVTNRWSKWPWPPQTGRATISVKPPLWRQINSIVGGLAQILFGLGVACYLMLFLLRR